MCRPTESFRSLYCAGIAAESASCVVFVQFKSDADVLIAVQGGQNQMNLPILPSKTLLTGRTAKYL